MAVIKIPSKHIYEKDNQKVIDNMIDKIEVQVQQPSMITEKQDVFSDAISPSKEFKGDSVLGFAGNGFDMKYPYTELTNFVAGYAEIIPLYNKYTIKIPVSGYENNGYIRELSFTNDGRLDANYSMIGYKETRSVNGSMPVTYIKTTAPNSRHYYFGQIGKVTITQTGTVTRENNIPITFDNALKSIHIPLRSSSDYNYDNVNTVLKNDLTNVQSPSIVKVDDKYWEMSFQILVGLDRIEAKNSLPTLSGNLHITAEDDPIQVPLVGTQEKYRAEQVSLTINGVVVKLKLTNKTLTIGDGKNIMSFSGNELIQTTNMYNNAITPITFTKGELIKADIASSNYMCYFDTGFTIDYNTAILTYNGEVANFVGVQDDKGILVSCKTGGEIASLPQGTVFVGIVQQDSASAIYNTYLRTITEWQNGKETATLTCDIADYYDEAGNLVISANGDDTLPMTFHLGDIVMPYIYGANGEDKPMSTYADGTPKVFTVIGKRPSKSGAFWQEITLQEKTD